MRRRNSAGRPTVMVMSSVGNVRECDIFSCAARVLKKCLDQYHTHTTDARTAIMDSGNNKQHLFNTPVYFPLGYTMHTISITGVNGKTRKTVGIGTAFFDTIMDNGKKYTWIVPHSIYDSACPVNLLCMDLFHFYPHTNHRTGYEVQFLNERILLHRGTHIDMPRNSQSHLYNVTLFPVSPDVARRKHISPTQTTACNMLNDMDAHPPTILFKHHELQPMSTTTAMRILNHPHEDYFNTTIKHNMLDHTSSVKPIRRTNRADRPDSYWAGKMTSCHVPQRSRRPANVKLTPGSHIVSDIGEVPIADRHHNRYFVLFKDMCTQYRCVYRMKRKDELASVYRMFLTDNRCTHANGTITYRTRYLVTDDDVMYVKGEVERINKEHLICKYTLAPYTHNANPAESEMRKIMEGAVCNLHASGLPPSFLLDALDCHIEAMNRVYTPICHVSSHQYMTPYERFHGTKPSINDIARFGSKTYVYIPKSERAKHDAHSWVGWYLGPCRNMRGCRVYRPLKHAVYDRYHTLHDSGTVYGDFLGDMFRQRVEADKRQREYFNNEVNDLLRSTPSTSSSPSAASILRQFPWAPQPSPSTARALMPPPPSRTTRATCTAPTPAPPTTTPPPMQTPLPPTTRSQSRTCTVTPQQQDSAPPERTEPPERIRARRLLEGIQPTKLAHIMEAVDLSHQFLTLTTFYSQAHACHAIPLDHLLDDIQSPSQLSFIQLCEKTSRRIANSKEPTTLNQIRKLIDSKTVEGALIKEAMLEEVLWMVNNGKVKPKDKSTVSDLHEIDGKWVIKYKKTLDGLLERVRARWVLRGDKQRPYHDFDPHQLYSPVASRAGTASALILALQYSLDLYAIDISKAFTASAMDCDNVHMRVPTGLDETHSDYAPHGTRTTWELLTTLYGLRQASSTYYNKFTSVLLAHTDSRGQKYRRSDHDPCVFTKGKLGSDDYITFSVHVDDKFVACSSSTLAQELVTVLADGGLVANIEPMNKVLGYRVKYEKHNPAIPGSGSITIDHSQYIRDAFIEYSTHFKDKSVVNIPMTDANTKQFYNQPTPSFCKDRYNLFRSILGKVAHCANFTHPECSVSVSILSQHMMNPSQLDLDLVFRVLRYLYHCVHHNRALLIYKYNPNFDPSTHTYTRHPVHLLCDADLSACQDTRRSRLGHALYLFGNLAAWCSKRQTSVSLSTAESEYVALSACAKLGIWYKGLISDMGVELSITHPIVILSDSRSAIAIATSPVGQVSKHSKHIEQRIHWFKELVVNGKLSVRFIAGEHNIADIFTKNLPAPKFIKFRTSLLEGDQRDLNDIPSQCLSAFLNRPAPLGYGASYSCSCCDSSNTFITTFMRMMDEL